VLNKSGHRPQKEGERCPCWSSMPKNAGGTRTPMLAIGAYSQRRTVPPSSVGSNAWLSRWRYYRRSETLPTRICPFCLEGSEIPL